MRCVGPDFIRKCTNALAGMFAVSISGFNNVNDFEGWNCGKITACGDLGKLCGGYNVKGKGSDINKVFELPPGTYSVELDFIQIDSWWVGARNDVMFVVSGAWGRMLGKVPYLK